MKDEGLRQRLLQESVGSDIMAERFIESERTKELGSNQSREIRGLDYENVDFFQKDQKDRYKDKKLNLGNERKNCTRCNRVHDWNKCNAYGTKCSNCKKTGHWAVYCRVKKIDEIRDYTKEENQEIEEEKYQFLGEISDREEKDPWIRQIQISINARKKVMRFKIDTGASVRLIEEISELPKLIHSTKTFIGPVKTNLKVLGYFIAKLSYRKLEIEEKIYVIQNQPTGLLSREVSLKLGMISLINEVE